MGFCGGFFGVTTSNLKPDLRLSPKSNILRLAIFPSKVPVRTLLRQRARGRRSHHLPCGEHPFICEQQYVSCDGASSDGLSFHHVFLQGVKLLSYLYNEAQNNCSNENYPVLLSLLKTSCEPYTRSVTAKKTVPKGNSLVILQGFLRLSVCFCFCSCSFVSDWVYSGVFRDVYGEFMIQVNAEYLGFRGETSHAFDYTNPLV